MLLRFFGSFRRATTGRDPDSDTGRQPPPRGGSAVDGDASHLFAGAHDFVVNQPTIIDRSQSINNIYASNTVLEVLLSFGTVGAMADSSARHPPPQCHPETRKSVRQRLQTWSSDDRRRWKMVWLYGPAGTGKSAVAQSFAEDCQARNCLGGAFFFSRLKGFDKPLCVVPTLAYQLAINIPGYKNTLTQILANDPAVLQMAMHIQFKKLIIEPFSLIKPHYLSGSQRHYTIILDGLDECEGEDAQCEIIEMISEAVRLRCDLPLVWLICSRSESHLKMTFSRVDFRISCGKEELLIDCETRGDVDRYLRDGLQKIHTKYRGVIASETWPDEHTFLRISRAVSGLFILAFSALEYIRDPEAANPDAQLASLVSFFESIGHLGNNPLSALDHFYTQILSAVPARILPVTMCILYICTRSGLTSDSSTRSSLLDRLIARENLLTAKNICDFLRLDEGTFHSSLRKLHSVIRVPAQAVDSKEELRFYHVSFRDFLWNQARSGKFSLPRDRIPLDIAKCSLYWNDVVLKLDWNHWGRTYTFSSRDQGVPHVDFPVLTGHEIEWWRRSYRLSRCFEPWTTCHHLGNQVDKALLFQLREFNYNLLPNMYYASLFANWVCTLGPAVVSDLGDKFLRTQPSYEVDLKLLDYLWAVSDPLEPLEPASFPIDLARRAKYPFRVESIYFLLGHGAKSCLVCISFYGQGYIEGILSLARPTNFRGCDQSPQDVDWEEARRRGDTYQAAFGLSDQAMILG